MYYRSILAIALMLSTFISIVSAQSISVDPSVVTISNTSYGPGGLMGNGTFQIKNESEYQAQVFISQWSHGPGDAVFEVSNATATAIIPKHSVWTYGSIRMTTNPQPLGNYQSVIYIPYKFTDSSTTHTLSFTVKCQVVPPTSIIPRPLIKRTLLLNKSETNYYDIRGREIKVSGEKNINGIILYRKGYKILLVK
jgi:hypothetical protein